MKVRKRELQYKYLLTCNGSVHIMKSEASPINITCDQDIDNLIWTCKYQVNLTANDFYVENLWSTNQILLFQMTDDLTIIPNESFQSFVDSCNSVIYSVADNDDDAIIEFSNQIYSKYLDIDHLNKLKPNPLASFNRIHTNLASLGKHFDELSTVVSLLKVYLITILFTINPLLPLLWMLFSCHGFLILAA